MASGGDTPWRQCSTFCSCSSRGRRCRICAARWSACWPLVRRRSAAGGVCQAQLIQEVLHHLHTPLCGRPGGTLHRGSSGSTCSGHSKHT
jgi:hypothetical protein